MPSLWWMTLPGRYWVRIMIDIPGYEGLYAITDDGKVWGYRHQGFMAQRKNRGGYLYIGLRKKGKRVWYEIHRLVATAYIPNPGNLPQVNHKDEDKTNNCVSNLEWVTSKENSNHGTRNARIGLSHSKPVYCVELDKVFPSGKVASNILGIGSYGIYETCRGGQKQTHGYHFRLANKEENTNA